MIFICFVNLNFLIRIVNVFLLKVKTNNACLCKAQDCHPKGDHGFPEGNNQGLRPCMLLKSSILTAKPLIVTRRVTILCFAQA